MEEVSTNFKSLPTEVLYKIFRLALKTDEVNTARNFALVSKTWVNPAQTVLYSNIIIKSRSQLKKFYKIVQHASHLGTKVKIFNLNIDSAYRYRQNSLVVNIELHELLTKLLCTCLPNLEVLNDQTLQSYLPVIEAFQYSQLRKLKRLSPPEHAITEGELANYATCVVFMKDRIEQIKIIEKKDRHGDVNINTFFYANRLYSKLDKFIKLKSLHLERKTDDDIQVLEHVTSTCKSLKSLSYESDPIDDDATFSLQSNNNPMVNLSTIIPSLSICALRCKVYVPNGYRNLLYMMHKFPKLKSFSLQMKLHNPVKLNRNTLAQLLKYSKGIKVFQVEDLRVDKDSISETMREYWDVPGGYGKWEVTIIFTNFNNTEETCSINIINNSAYSKFSIKYSASTADQHYLNFIEKNGVFMKRLKFNNSIFDLSNKFELPDYFIRHAITHCPHLKALHIIACIFASSTPSSVDLNRTASLDLLHLESCDLIELALKQSSPYLHKLSELRISKWTYIYLLRSVKISMEYTRVDRLIFRNSYIGQALYLKFLTADQKENYYYCYDGDLGLSSEQNYMEKNDETHLSICCQNIPKFEFIRR